MRSIALLVALAACSKGPSQPKIVTDPLMVTVLDSATQKPIAGALLALDDKNGVRLDGTTDANGTFTFQVDWSQMPYVVTAWADSHALATYVGLTKFTTFTVELGKNVVSDEGTAISGKLLGKDMPSDAVTISASVPSTYYQDITPTYSMTVTTDQPYHLYALDFIVGGQPQTPSKRGVAQTFKKWVEVDAPAPSASPMVDIDFNAGTPLTPVHTSGTMAIPGGTSGVFAQSTAYVTVTDVDSAFFSFLGAPLFIDVSSDGTQFTFNEEFVQPKEVGRPITTYSISTNGGAITAKNDSAWPSDGVNLTDLLDAVTISSPAPGVALQLGEAPGFDAPSGDVASFMQVIVNRGQPSQQVVWYVYGSAGAPLAIPPLPTGVDAQVAMPPGPLSGQIDLCSPAKGTLCTYFSEGVPFVIARP